MPLGTVAGEFKLEAGGAWEACSRTAISWPEHEASTKRVPPAAPRRIRETDPFTFEPSLA